MAKIGRPLKGEEACRKVLVVRVGEGLLEKIRMESSVNGVSVSEWLRRVVTGVLSRKE